LPFGPLGGGGHQALEAGVLGVLAGAQGDNRARDKENSAAAARGWFPNAHPKQD
jgi:hypothetical protein